MTTLDEGFVATGGLGVHVVNGVARRYVHTLSGEVHIRTTMCRCSVAEAAWGGCCPRIRCLSAFMHVTRGQSVVPPMGSIVDGRGTPASARS